MNTKIVRGRVWKFGDNISTDIMMPGQTLHGKVPKERMQEYCMVAIRPEFPKEVKPGDIIVAGRNFGCGSSRPAPINFIALKVGCIVAESFAGIFFRNAISMGFPVVELPSITLLFEDGDLGEVDFECGIVMNLDTGASLSFSRYPDLIMDILESGGMLELLRKESKESTIRN